MTDKEPNAETSAQKQPKVKRKAPGRPFLPGQSGNPAGRPKGSVSITSAIKAKLEEQYNDLKNPDDRKTYLERIIEAIFHNAIEVKDARSLKDIWAYIDGQPKQTMDLGVDKDSIEELTDFFRIVAKGKKDA